MIYRADLDGLRAVAILLVLLDHAHLSFTGGYIGVDIFFVLSGYLITGQTRAQLQKGTFRLKEFWARRVCRLAPALLACLSFTWLAALLCFLPKHFTGVGEAILAQLFCASNYYYAAVQEHGYFAAGNEVYPALHTWSLAVEEQFYLFFGLTILFIRRPARWAALAGVISLAAGAFYLRAYPQAVFYGAPFRVWEFLVGASLVFAPPIPAKGANPLVILGAILILVPALVYQESTPFPALAALPPVLGTALLLHCQDTVASRFLSRKPMVLIGKISYPLYLWHWPLLALAAYIRGIGTGPALSGLLMLVSACISIISYVYLERPFRYGKLRGRAIAICAVWAALLALACNLSILTGGLPQRLPPRILALQSSARGLLSDRFNEGSGRVRIRDGVLPMLGHNGRETNDFLLWGDSHANVLSSPFRKIASEKGMSGILVAHGATPPLLDRDSGDNAHATLTLQSQKQLGEDILKLMERRHIPKVFLAGYWAIYNRSLPRYLASTVETLRNRGVRVFIVRDSPYPGIDVARVIPLRLSYGLDCHSFETTQATYDVRNNFIDPYLAKLTPKVDTVDIGPAFLGPDGRYKNYDNGGIYYYDKDHLSVYGASRVEAVVREGLER